MLIHERAASGSSTFVIRFGLMRRCLWLELQRSSIPSSLQGNASSFDIATLGVPAANWPTSGCPIDQFFSAQQLVFDITLCGDKCVLSFDRL